jgi:large subunit ribosomal protein L25
MTSQEINLELESRTQIRKKLNALKREGKVPGVLHNPGSESIALTGSYVEISKAYALAGKHHPINLKVDGKAYLTIIKDADFDPKKHQLRHVVFGTIKQNEKVETEVPIIFEGDAPASKKSLLIIRQLDQVKLEAFPRDLPDNVVLNIESLEEVGDKLNVSDITVQSGVTILTEPEHSVAIVEETPAQMSAEAEAESEDTSEAPATTEAEKSNEEA